MRVVPVVDEHGRGGCEVPDTNVITVHTIAGASVVQVVGDLDLAVVDELRTALTEALANGPWLIVDLRRVEATDSVGLSVLVAARHAARRQAGDLLLAAAPPFFRSVLRAARLDTTLSTFETVPQAITWALRAGHGVPGAAAPNPKHATTDLGSAAKNN